MAKFWKTGLFSFKKGCKTNYVIEFYTWAMELNTTCEWLALLLHIQKVVGSKFDLETSYPD
jgi:hypothetical protein